MTFQLDTVAGLPQYAGIDPDTGVPMDSQDRYLVPDPDNPAAGRKSNQRCTNLASMLESRYALEINDQNNLIMGMGHRDDLRMIALGLAEKERETGARDKALLRQIRTQAIAAGNGDVKANRGTAAHLFSEIVDAGGMPNLGQDQVRHAPSLQAYNNVLIKYGIRPALDAIGNEIPLQFSTEIVLHDPRIEVVGRVDKIRRIYGRNRIVDVKTGEDPLRYGALAYAMQLAILAHCPYRWDEATQRHYPAIPVDKEIAYLIHIPSGGDYAELIAIDIARAWRYVLLALQVRESRNVKANELASPLGRVGADEQVTPAPPMPFPLEASQAAAVLNGLPAVVEQHAAPGPGEPYTYVNDRGEIVRIPGPVPGEPVLFHPAGGPSGTIPVAPLSTSAVPDSSRVKVLVQNGQRVEAPTELPGYGLAYVPDGIPGQQLAPVPAAGAPSTPETAVTVPAAGGAQQDATTATGRAKPKCARCRRPGHQTRTCSYLTHGETGAALADDKVSGILQGGKAPDEAAYKLATVANIGSPAVDLDGVDEINDPDPNDQLTTDRSESTSRYCTCPSPAAGQHGWLKRPDGIYLHKAPGCGLPSYAATMRANASAAAQLPGQDPGTYAMSVQAVQFFTEHVDFPPPATLIEAGWPPPFDDRSTTSAPAAGVTTTPAPASPSGGGIGPATTSAPSPTVPPATPAASQGSPVSTAGATTHTPLSSTPPTAAPDVAEFTDWAARLATVPDLALLQAEVQRCIAAGGWDQPAANAATRRQFELQQAGGPS